MKGHDGLKFGDQLWNLGYESSDHDEDIDHGYDLDEDENIEEAKIEILIL